MLDDARLQLLLSLKIVLVSRLLLLRSLFDLAPIVGRIVRCVAEELILLGNERLLDLVTGLDWALVEGFVEAVIVHLVLRSSVSSVDFSARLIQALPLVGAGSYPAHVAVMLLG